MIVHISTYRYLKINEIFCKNYTTCFLSYPCLFQKVGEDTTLSCWPLGNPLKGYNKGTVRFHVVFNSGGLRGNEDFVNIQLEVLSSNQEDNSTKFDNKKTVSIRVTASADIATSVKAIPEQVSTYHEL